MKILTAQSKLSLFEEVQSVKSGEKEVYVSLRPTMEIVNKILERSPSLKTVSCPKSLYLQVSRKVFKSLADKGIQINAGEWKAGRPMKHDIELIKEVIKQRADGKGAKKIAEDINIPLRTVYFYLRNGVPETKTSPGSGAEVF
ncbi:MAG: DUF1699 domain-containing protein [Candidatus Micrarchaeota archaeon]